MNSDIYIKLSERLNQFQTNVPAVNAFYKLLADIYTEEEADTAVNFPHGRFTMTELADVYNKEEPELFPLIETMTDKGQIFYTKKTDGEKLYELSPWLPGVAEFEVLRRLADPDPEAIERYNRLSAEVRKEVAELTAPLMADKEAFKASRAKPFLRVIPITESIADNKEKQSYEDVMEMIEREESFAVTKCVCRENSARKGQPCSNHDIPEYSCLHFGALADYLVETNIGKRITREESRGIVNTCSDAGTVLNTNNFSEGLQTVCNCCSCCCYNLTIIKMIGNLKQIGTSNYLAVVDEDTCTACGDCAERCPVNAISVDDDIAMVDSDLCLGCGNCTTACPVESMVLDRQSDIKPVIGDDRVGLGF